MSTVQKYTAPFGSDCVKYVTSQPFSSALPTVETMW